MRVGAALVGLRQPILHTGRWCILTHEEHPHCTKVDVMEMMVLFPPPLMALSSFFVLILSQNQSGISESQDRR